MSSAEDLKKKIDRAVEAAESEKAKLLKRDGTRIYSDTEHDGRLRQIDDKFNRITNEVAEELDTIAEEKEAELVQYRYGDPTDALVGPQLENANAKRIFVKEDCETLPMPDLGRRLRGVLEGGKKESIWLHARYAKMRLADIDRKVRDGVISPQKTEGITEVRTTLALLEDKVTSSVDKREAERTETELQAARDAKRYLYSRCAQVDGSDERARDVQRARVSSL
jgi:hypothetical protein